VNVPSGSGAVLATVLGVESTGWDQPAPSQVQADA